MGHWRPERGGGDGAFAPLDFALANGTLKLLKNIGSLIGSPYTSYIIPPEIPSAT